MRLGQLLVTLEDQLEAVGEERAALSYVFQEKKGWTRTELILQLNQPVSESDQLLLEEIAQQLMAHVPAQHLTGKAYFRDLELKVGPAVLIPRPETEELVDLILSENSRADLRVLDMGTGSGAIALSLKQARPDWLVTASDISVDALAIAQENAQKNQLEVQFVQSDVFAQIDGKFDLIVSNPPYIAYEDSAEVGQNVLLYEPHMALFAQEDGYAIYRKILENAKNYLAIDGKIYFEIGYKQGLGLETLSQTYLPEKRVRVLKDVFGKDRMVAIDEYQ
ncbi:release factor glutamine methyltransferase [Streptococcus rupicaprae]|uniref:Release factor glutamine methyltransferase n=1 Tax=Streptococcus rupicaprae TaxID=759619 RepID=A0ABV2FFI4_9STRE